MYGLAPLEAVVCADVLLIPASIKNPASRKHKNTLFPAKKENDLFMRFGFGIKGLSIKNVIWLDSF